MASETLPLIHEKGKEVAHSHSTYSSFERSPDPHHHLSIESSEVVNNKKERHILHVSTEDRAEKSIGSLGSFVLIVNNLTGPGMLGFPHLFQTAGILPTLCGIVFVYLSASLCGTLLADSIASIPKNQTYDLQIDFSSAFRYTVGEDWYVVAETLFLISCAVQACAGIVETAQSLDGYIASFLVGKTYAIEIYPNLQLISWSPTNCHQQTETMDESNLADCTPFHDAGSLVFTLGFAITMLIFLPLGRGHLKETILVQFISFAFMIILLFQFSGEFVHRGLEYQLPLVGNELSQLAGVILFNYAFCITIPSWLNEKETKVSVNKVVWTSSTLASIIYAAFGILGGMAFAQVGPNILILLTSSKVHYVTRLCAALFGVMIIGCGVPVFCVIIKSALFRNEVCSHGWAMFFGAFMPYLLSWTLYQGTLLLSMLNWTGLVVNGLVAFLLPMVLALKTTELRNHRAKSVEMTIEATPSTEMIELGNDLESSEKEGLLQSERVSDPDSILIQDIDVIESQKSETIPLPSKLLESNSKDELKESSFIDQDLDLPVDDREYGGYHHYLRKRLLSSTTVQPLPIWLEYYRREIVLFMMFTFGSIIALTILEDAIEGISPPPED